MESGKMAMDAAFRGTCRIIFGREIGGIEGYGEYLGGYTLPCHLGKSCISGKEVVTTLGYPKGAKLVSQDEIGKLGFKAVDTASIRDIDSLLEAIGENVVYCGNRRFGKNLNVERSDNIVNCQNVWDSQSVFHSRFCAHTSLSRECDHCFGLFAHPFARFSMRCVWGMDVTRCFEGYCCNNSSDCLFSYNMGGCSDTLFSFNLRNARNVIGNVELPKERYVELKKKILGEIAEELEREKRFPSLIEIVREYGGVGDGVPEYIESLKEREGKTKRIGESFAVASKIVLGRELGGMLKYEDWLLGGSVRVKVVRGADGKEAHRVDSVVPGLKDVPQERFVGGEEALRLGKEKKAEIGDGVGLAGILEEAGRIGYFTHEFRFGASMGLVDNPISYSSVDIYKVFDTTNSKHSGCTFTAIESEYVFGGRYRMLHSRMCINCFESTSLSCCFEVDSSFSTANSFFCHNCENLDGGIFCFNAKGKRYAVGNTEVGRGEYLRIRKILLDYVVGELEGKGELGLSILKIGEREKREIRGK
ncbi:hypothetical protein JW721_05180 [Candidatus Micrarchaeota archaeon]|nr:hypothetical protein [Candidatus Micrarchaeota archaeon]